MMKYLLGILSTLASLLFGTVALAGEFTLHATNLPLVQSYKEPLPIELSLSTPAFSGESQTATLTVDDCGKVLELFHNGQPVSQLPLTVAPEQNYDFLFMITKETKRECLLTFSILDTEKTLLASTSVLITPACTSNTEIPTDEEALPDETLRGDIVDTASTPSTTDTPLDTTEPSSPSESSTPPKSPSKPKTPSQTSVKPVEKSAPQPMITTTSTELDGAFSLLVEKGLLTTGDKTKLSQPLTRIAAAELFVKIAITKGYERDTKKDCRFTDMTDSTDKDIAIARLACEFNIMGINPNHTPIAEFAPEMTIPSEQLATAFSRLMWRELYENPDTGDYYQLHMNTLYNLGIIDTVVVDSPSLLADFIVIFARAIEKEQFAIDTIETLNLQCETGENASSSCELPKEKSRFRFW
jgi:hypothetical protein